MTKVELLAPAGTIESLYAAVNSGADAIYMGGNKFSARAYASNFANEQLIKAVDYAHLYGVKIYITLNTLIKDDEIEEVIDYISFLYTIGVDALIIQDFGVFNIIKKYFKDFEIHASTQMTVHNGEGAIFLKKLGFQRIVLSRELSLSEIKHISKDLDIETEIFVHGALCICYSGQCLMSSMIGGRSGNRGRCAQPCRLPYTLIDTKNNKEKAAYILSPKDICTIENIKDLIDTGTASLKIEGRMKRPEYVAGVVSNYKNAISSINYKNNKFNIKDSKKELLQLFNREGFSSAYLYKNEGKDMMAYTFPKNTGIYLGKVNKDFSITLQEDISLKDGIRNGETGFTISKIMLSGKDVSSGKKGDIVKLFPVNYKPNDNLYKTLDTKLMEFYEGYYNDPYYNKIELDFYLYFKLGEAIKLGAYYDDTYFETSSDVVQEAINKPISKEKITENLNKTKDTPFSIRNINFTYFDDGFTPISSINYLRRTLLEEIEKYIVNKYRRKSKVINIQDKEQISLDEKTNLPHLMVGINNKDQLKALLKTEANDVTVNLFYKGTEGLKEEDLALLSKKNIYIKVPNIIKEEFEDVCKLIERNLNVVKGIVTANLGIINRFKGKISIIGDYKLNILNKYALETLNSFTDLNCLSLELNKKEVQRLLKETDIPCQFMIYGKPELMISEYCPIGSIMGGKSKDTSCEGACMKGKFILKDRKNEQFLLKTDKYCRCYIYNPSPINLIINKEELEGMGIKSFRMDLIDEDHEETLNIIKSFFGESITDDSKSYTRGHYKRGVE